MIESRKKQEEQLERLAKRLDFDEYLRIAQGRSYVRLFNEEVELEEIEMNDDEVYPNVGR